MNGKLPRISPSAGYHLTKQQPSLMTGSFSISTIRIIPRRSIDTISSVSRNSLLIVAYTERPEGIRLISARELTPAEREAYEEAEPEMSDELRSEYDLKNLRVRKLGPDRKNFGGTIRLEPDVAEVFPDADSVNEALRFLIRVTKENQASRHDTTR